MNCNEYEIFTLDDSKISTQHFKEIEERTRQQNPHIEDDDKIETVVHKIVEKTKNFDAIESMTKESFHIVHDRFDEVLSRFVLCRGAQVLEIYSKMHCSPAQTQHVDCYQFSNFFDANAAMSDLSSSLIDDGQEVYVKNDIAQVQ